MKTIKESCIYNTKSVCKNDCRNCRNFETSEDYERRMRIAEFENRHAINW